MDDPYREELLDHYEHPHHHGALADADIFTIGDNNPSCGDRITIDVKLSPDRARIADIAFRGDGCVISQAATSMLRGHAVVGKSVDAVQRLDRHAVLDPLGLPPDADARQVRHVGAESVTGGAVSRTGRSGVTHG